MKKQTDQTLNLAERIDSLENELKEVKKAYADMLDDLCDANEAFMINLLYEKALEKIVDYEHGHCTMPEDLKEIARDVLSTVKAMEEKKDGFNQ